MRILIVEDEHRLANTIKKGLEQERYAVDVTYDGTSGYDFASTEDYDLLILDLMLPGMDGLEICRKLREKNIHTPILMLTARDQITDKVNGLNSGADDYLTKPFAFNELLARIRALLRRTKETKGDRLTLDDLEMDIQSYVVKRGEKEIQLSSKEFGLLQYLLRNPNQILSKDQIISHVWDYDADILPNTVEVFIRKLRDKIDRPFNNKKCLIQTVRGFGYRITDK